MVSLTSPPKVSVFNDLGILQIAALRLETVNRKKTIFTVQKLTTEVQAKVLRGVKCFYFLRSIVWAE